MDWGCFFWGLPLYRDKPRGDFSLYEFAIILENGIPRTWIAKA